MLSIGKFARYRRTGTCGKIIDIKDIEGKTWAQLDNGFYYNINYLEPISKIRYKSRERAEETVDEKLMRWIKRIEKEEGKIKLEGDLGGAG